MSSQRVFALTGRIIRQFVRDRRTMALLFIAPLVIMTILNFVLNGSSSTATLALAANSGQTGTFVQALRDQLDGKNGLTVTFIAPSQADDTLKNGDADGVLIFPDDFVTALRAGSASVQLKLEGTNPGLAKQLTSNVTLLLSGFAQPTSNATAQISLAEPEYLYGGKEYTQTDALAPLFIGLFSFFFVFLLTSVAFLRERSQGTIERLMVSPLSRTELVLGYVIGFTIFALVQSIVILSYVIYVLQVHYKGNLANLFVVTALLTIGGVNLGIFVSSFARNELQIVQFIPLLIVPQILLGGLFFPVKTLPPVLYQLAYVFPITYANIALKNVMFKAFSLGDIWPQLTFLVGFAVLMIILSSFSLRGERV